MVDYMEVKESKILRTIMIFLVNTWANGGDSYQDRKH